MDILLHLGAHRCASTTFQSYLRGNRRHLAHLGLTSWTPKRTRDGLLRGLVRHPERISVEDERYAIRSVGRVRVELARLVNLGQSGLLLSDENIIGSMRSNVAERSLYPLVQERLMRFTPAFDGHRLTIGLAIRSYEDYWTSCMASLMSRGGAVPHVDLLDHLTTQPRRWRTVVRDIATAFPNVRIVVWPFERLAGRPDCQLREMWTNQAELPSEPEIWHNRGADLVRLNALLAMRGEPLLVDDPCEVGARWMPFDEAQSAVLRAEYRRDLAWFAAGAEGLAHFVDGRSATPDGMPNHTATPKPTPNTGSEGSTPAPGPDRAELKRTAELNAVLFGGRHDGIEQSQHGIGLGRTGAS